MSGEAINTADITSEEGHRTFSRTGLASVVICPACGKIVSMNWGKASLLQVGYPMNPCNYSVGKILLAV